MKHIAVAGVGAIGSIVGGKLALAGRDVTLICTGWRENLEHMRAHGLTVTDGVVEETTAVNALFIDELDRLTAPIDLLFVAGKSNDTERCLAALGPHLAPDGVVVSLQNGINEDVIVPLVGRERVIACVSYTGGMLKRPGYVWTHGGKFVVGELDGSLSPRVQAVAAILGLVTQTEVTRDIMRQRWDKLAQVTMTVPVGALLGVGFPAVLSVVEAHPVLARLMCETLAVAQAAGHPLDEVVGLTAADWRRLADGQAPDLTDIVIGPFRPRPGVPPPDPGDAPLLKDLRLGLPLEIDHTNGYLIQTARELGVATPAHDFVFALLKRLEKGELKPSLEHLQTLLDGTAATGHASG
jgi:2-dehydropantoate 2-reductase